MAKRALHRVKELSGRSDARSQKRLGILERYLKKKPSIAERRLRVTREQIPIQEHWVGWFLERGNVKMSQKQRAHVDKLYRRKSRLETYLARKKT